MLLLKMGNQLALVLTLERHLESRLVSENLEYFVLSKICKSILKETWASQRKQDTAVVNAGIVFTDLYLKHHIEKFWQGYVIFVSET